MSTAVRGGGAKSIVHSILASVTRQKFVIRMKNLPIELG